MYNQQSNSYQQFIPAGDEILEKRLKSPNWNIRKQAYEQILYLIQQQQIVSANNVFEIGGKQYTVKKLIPIFQNIVDEDHPLVLLCALQCVQMMIQKQLCSGREFIKLTDQGFDKFPLKTNRGKQIMQKFADIIQKIQVQPQFLFNKLNTSSHQKCVIFALEVAGMLGMTQLLKKIRQIAQKHAKKAVRQVATEISQQLQELQTQATEQPEYSAKANLNPDEIQNNSTQNLKIPAKSKQRKKTPTKPNKAPQPQQTNTFTKSQLDILQKVAQFQKLNSKQQQKQIQSLSSLFQRHFNLIKQGKPVPILPSNQLGNLSYVIRITIQSNNVILATNGLKLLKTLTENNCPLIPRSYPLLFIFEKYKLRASHQVNQLLFDVCDSLLLANSISTIRNIDLLQAVSQGANNKKENVKIGSFMVFLRCVSLLYKNQRLFVENFGNDEHQDSQKFIEIFQKINQGDLEKIKAKLHKNLTKCLQNFSSKMGDDKKYDDKLQDVRIIMSLAYGVSSNNPTITKSAVSIDNINKRTLTKTLSQVSPKVQTYNNPKSKPIQNQQSQASHSINKQKSVHSIRNPNTNPQMAYKILNPQQKSNKILSLCSNPTPGSISSMKKLVLQSLIQFQECIDQHRFQLFYYSQVLDYFISSYEPHDKTADIISEYMLQLLLKISKMKSKNLKLGSAAANTKYLQQGIRNIIKICLCDLFLGQDELCQILNNLAQNNGINNIIDALIMLNQCKRQNKIKKKNRKIILQWLDSNVPTQCLSDNLFQIMDKIEKGLPLGVIVQSQKQERQDRQDRQERGSDEKKFRQTFGREKQKQQQQSQYYQNNPQMVKKITFNSNQQQQEHDFVSNQVKNKKQSLPSYDEIRNKVKDEKQKKIHVNQHQNIYQNYNQDDRQQLQRKQTNKVPIKNKQPKQTKQPIQASSNEPLKYNYKGQYSQKLKQKQQQLKNQQIKFLQHLQKSSSPSPSPLQEAQSPNPKYNTIFSQLSPSPSPSSIQQPSSIFSNLNNKNIPTPNISKNNPQNVNLYPPTNPLDRSQISYIDYKQDPSISLLASGYGGASTERQILQQYQQIQHQQQKQQNVKNKDNKLYNNYISSYQNGYGDGDGDGQDGDQQDTSKYQKYYNQYKKQKQIQSQIKQKQYQQSIIKSKEEIDRKYNTKTAKNTNKDLQYSIDNPSISKDDNKQDEQQEQQDKQTVQNYKRYIQNIRKAYLPKQYIQKNQPSHTPLSLQQPKIQVNKNNIENNDKKDIRLKYQQPTPGQQQQQQQQIKSTILPIKQPIKQIISSSNQQQTTKPLQPKNQQKQTKEISNKTQIKKQPSQQSQQSQQQQPQPQFEYKLLNSNKLNYMLQHASNPYSHLRNEIIMPFKKSQQKQYFIKQLNLFITSLPQIKQPQPYNALLLTIILLFSQIQTKPTLLDPLQQLYSHMASLISTNQFLRTIISLFHSVIEETSSHQRDFLIIILTKSVSRLMPFCQDPVLLLRDLAQFYNVGQNVYFQMYEKEYMEICKVIEGNALYEVVQGGLVKQGENLNVIVDSFYETRFKNKVKEYIKEIISENQEQGLDDEHRYNGDQEQY